MVWTGYKTVKYQVICTSFISVQNYRVTFANLVVKPVFISRHLYSICTAQWTIRLSLHFMQTQPCPLLRADFKFSSETSPSKNIGRRVYWIASTRPFSLLRYQLLFLLHCPWKNIFFTSAVILFLPKLWLTAMILFVGSCLWISEDYHTRVRFYFGS